MVYARTKFVAAVVVACFAVQAYGQFTEPVTGFETDRNGVLLSFQPASYGDLKVVMFQDPAEANVTTANIVGDTDPNADTSGLLPATEESFVSNFVGDGFFGAGGSDQSMDIRFQWANSNGQRWCLVETFQSPLLGDPSIHLNGVVRMKVNFPLVTSEFPALTYTSKIGVALLVRETGNDFPQGFQDGGAGALEFVGVSTVGFADTANPVPVPTTFITGPTTSGDGGWIDLTFDLDALQTAGEVAGWTFNGGNGILDATTNGDLVNRGVLAGLVLTVDQTDVTSDYVEFLVDNVEFDAPVVDPAFPPSIGTPVVASQISVRVNDVLSSATDVQLEIDRSDVDNADPFVADETFNTNPAGALFLDFPVAALAVGDRVRARQTNPSGVSGYSTEILVNPPAAFSLSISLDEDGNFGAAPADFEFVGASSAPGGAPQGKLVFAQNGTWQNFEISLVPGAEPVLDFAGGNGVLTPDGGLYNIDALWMTIDPSAPNAGPYEVFIDHLYYVDATDTQVLISDAESGNPFPNFRGQSTDINSVGVRSTTISTLASYDGLSSNRIAWTWPDTTTSNTVAPFRPAVAFADTAKAVGMWVYVAEISTNSVPEAVVPGPIVGPADGVVVDITTTGVTSVELFLNGVSLGSINTTGATQVSFDTTTTGLVVGDVLSATQTTAVGTSDLSRPRGDTLPPAPTVVQPLRGLDTVVDVADVLDAPFAKASLVTVLDSNGVVLGTAVPTGTTVSVTVSPLAVGMKIVARQTVNGLESGNSGLAPVIGSGFCITVFEDNLDTGAGWTVNSSSADTSFQFGWDFSTLGIPLSPNGSTTGLRMAANIAAPTGAESIIASPTTLSMSGAYQVRFDFWINANGPFPGGGAGSTEFIGGGVGYDINSTGLDGASLIATGEGGASSDWRLYKNAGQQYVASGQYDVSSNNASGSEISAAFPGLPAPALQQANFPQQTGTLQSGSAGFAWHEMVITVDSDLGLANFTVDGLSIGTVNANIGNTVDTVGNVSLIYADLFSSVSDNPALSFGVFNNLRVLVQQPTVVTLGDWDNDGDQDKADFAHFVDCLAGPGAVPTPSLADCADACIDTFDADGDSDVDLKDFQLMTSMGFFQL